MQLLFIQVLVIVNITNLIDLKKTVISTELRNK